MNALATKFGVNAAALAVVGAAAVIPMQAAAQAAPVSTYASQWSQSVDAVVSDLATAPAFLSDPASQIFCFARNGSCLETPGAVVLFSFDFAAVAATIPVVGPWLATQIAKFNFSSCVFGFCNAAGPYGTET